MRVRIALHCRLTRRTFSQDDPVDAFLLIVIDPLAVIAAHALGNGDAGSINCSPFTCVFTNLAGVAFAPAFNAKDR